MKSAKSILSHLLSFGLVLSVFVSCTEEIDIKLRGDSKRLVVQGILGIEPDMHTVILSRTLDYFESGYEMPYISNANVSITELETGNIFTLSENPDKPGHYQTEPTVYATQGYSYRLDISNVYLTEDSEPQAYTGTSFCPYIAEKIDSITNRRGINEIGHIFGGIFASKDTGYNVALYAKDPPTHEYYAFVLYKNGTNINDTITKLFIIDDDIFGKSPYIYNLPLVFLAEEKDGNERLYSGKAGDSVVMEIRSISKEYYNYINEFTDVYGGSNPMMGGAPANVRGNIDNGAIGFFAVYGNRRAYTILGQ